jgi:hypothetical protein
VASNFTCIHRLRDIDGYFLVPFGDNLDKLQCEWAGFIYSGESSVAHENPRSFVWHATTPPALEQMHLLRSMSSSVYSRVFAAPLPTGCANDGQPNSGRALLALEFDHLRRRKEIELRSLPGNSSRRAHLQARLMQQP